jgi:hypothetical protein
MAKPDRTSFASRILEAFEKPALTIFLRLINSAALLGVMSFLVLILGGAIVSARQQCFKDGDLLMPQVFPLSDAITEHKFAYALALFKSSSADELLSQVELQKSVVGAISSNAFFGKTTKELQHLAMQIEGRMNQDQLLLTTSPFDDGLPNFETDATLLALDKNPIAREQAFQRMKQDIAVFRTKMVKENLDLRARPAVYVDCSITRIVTRWISGEQSVLGIQARKSGLVRGLDGEITFAPSTPKQSGK